MFLVVCICMSRANLNVCFFSSQSSFKETYMYDFFKSFQEDKCIGKVKKVFLNILINECKCCCM